MTLTELAAKSAARKQSDEEWKQAVRQAVRKHSLRTVATFAGVSHARVAQIVRAGK